MIKSQVLINFLGGEIQVGGAIAEDKSHAVLTLNDMDKPEKIGTNLGKNYNVNHDVVMVFHHKESIDVVIEMLKTLKEKL